MFYICLWHILNISLSFCLFSCWWTVVNALPPAGSPSPSPPSLSLSLPNPGFSSGLHHLPCGSFWLAVLGKCSVLKHYSQPASPGFEAEWDALFHPLTVEVGQRFSTGPDQIRLDWTVSSEPSKTLLHSVKQATLRQRLCAVLRLQGYKSLVYSCYEKWNEYLRVLGMNFWTQKKCVTFLWEAENKRMKNIIIQPWPHWLGHFIEAYRSSSQAAITDCRCWKKDRAVRHVICSMMSTWRGKIDIKVRKVCEEREPSRSGGVWTECPPAAERIVPAFMIDFFFLSLSHSIF